MGAEDLRAGQSAWGTLKPTENTEGKSEDGTYVKRTSNAESVLMSTILKMKNTIFLT